jgi:hypothetical protein
VFAVDLLLWFVSGFSLLMLACSTLSVIYFCIRKTLETLFSRLSPAWHVRMTRPATGDVPSTLGKVGPALAAVYQNGRTKPRAVGALNVTTTGSWGPIDHNLSTETAEKIERIMAIGLGMSIVRGIRVHARSHRGWRLRSSKLSPTAPVTIASSADACRKWARAGTGPLIAGHQQR